MHIYEYGDRNKPVILLLPDAGCDHEGCFKEVIPSLMEHFYVAAVNYTGFDPSDQDQIFQTTTVEAGLIEDYMAIHFGGRIFAVYGSGFGGTMAAILLARHALIMKHVLIGSSPLDEESRARAMVRTTLMLPDIYPLVKEGAFKNPLKKAYHKLRLKNAYEEKYLARYGSGKAYVSEDSLRNQIFTDLITKLPENLSCPGTLVSVFYAKKMGTIYWERYKKHFKNPDIVSLDVEFEEYLLMEPEKWLSLLLTACEKEPAHLQVTRATIMGELLEYDIGVAEVLTKSGMHCIGCPSSIKESLGQACEVHGLSIDEILSEIHAYFRDKGLE